MRTKNAIFSKIKQFRAIVSIDDLHELLKDLPSWKSTWRHFSAVGSAIWMKFGRLVQNNMPTVVIRSKSKPGVELQYGERLFFQTGNSHISAADWDVPTKFGLLIETDIRKTATSPDLKPGVKLHRSGRHLENRYNIISSLRMDRLGRNSAIKWDYESDMSSTVI